MADPEFLKPFVVPAKSPAVERRGAVDLYVPEAAEPWPAVLVVHGGPLPAELRPTPREWPVYVGYGSLAAARGALGVVLDHGLHTPGDYASAAADVAAALELVRGDPRVDGDRIALWFFSGGGLLAADWLRTPPSWLRCVAATYPVLEPLPGWDVEQRFRPCEAVAGAGPTPLVLTRVGREQPPIAAGVERFVESARTAGARLEIIDVPDGHHGFDFLDDTDASRAAIEQAFDAVLAALT